MKYIFPVIFIPILAILLCSCDEDNPPPPPTVTMTILDAPAALLANADSCYLYRVKLEATVADSVTVEVRDPDHQLHSTFALYDDGGTGSAFPEYSCEGSGDIIPNDVIYSRRISGRLLADNVLGEYSFVFRAPGISEQVRTVQVLNVEECVIIADPLISSFPACFAPVTIEAQVARTEGDVVDSVRVYLYDLSDGSNLTQADFSPTMGDTLWGVTLTPTFLRCTPTGSNYGLRYYAKTRFGMECTATLAAVTVTNSLPVLSNSTLPDTILRPTDPDRTDTVAVTVNMQDCELSGEWFYYGLKFDVRREDTTDWTPSDSFFLRDDGVLPDVVPGNGVFTVGLTFVRRDDLPNYVYYFRFYAIECAAPYDTSEYLLDSVRVIQPDAVMSPLDPPAMRGETRADFGVWQPGSGRVLSEPLHNKPVLTTL